jgi:chemotaxis response regulator CheB
MNKRNIVVIGVSAGGFEALKKLVAVNKPANIFNSKKALSACG